MRRVSSALLVLILLFLCLSFFASAEGSGNITTDDGYQYRILPDGTAMLVSYSGSSNDVTIPSEFGGAILTVIGTFISDVLLAWLDPRARKEYLKG